MGGDGVKVHVMGVMFYVSFLLFTVTKTFMDVVPLSTSAGLPHQELLRSLRFAGLTRLTGARPALFFWLRFR